ncbi:MAG: hypothetical protein ISEC1_P0988 [Thiomicrorhabdus sp.]|nr:MAG: hypothetical protein ISEC1_P0988 [Thiomicrorhabdus sp.]
MLGNKVSVFGGTGFVGREVVNALSKAGYEVSLLVRRPQRFRDFALYPNTKVVELTAYDDADLLDTALVNTDIVVNLLSDRSTGPEMVEADDLLTVSQDVKSAVERAGIQRVMSLSQIGASEQAKSEWRSLQAKVDDVMLSTQGADVSIMKPSLLIGENDDTTARYAKQLNRMPLLMVAQSTVVVQPIWVRDFAQVFAASVGNVATFGQMVDIAGEERMTIKELAELVMEIMQKQAVLFPVCPLNAKFMAKLGALAPVVSISSSQLQMLCGDMVTESDFSSSFGFVPSGLELVIAGYAVPHDVRARFNYFRKEAGRNADELV